MAAITVIIIPGDRGRFHFGWSSILPRQRKNRHTGAPGCRLRIAEKGQASPRNFLPIAILPSHRIGMARPPKLDWTQIRSDALDLPYSLGSEPLEPKPTYPVCALIAV